jgi:hypothetical protein
MLAAWNTTPSTVGLCTDCRKPFAAVTSRVLRGEWLTEARDIPTRYQKGGINPICDYLPTLSQNTGNDGQHTDLQDSLDRRFRRLHYYDTTRQTSICMELIIIVACHGVAYVPLRLKVRDYHSIRGRRATTLSG